MYSQMRDPHTNQIAASIIRDSDGAVIPNDLGNLDYQAFEAWLAAGNSPTPAPSAPPPAPILTFLQFMALFTPAEQTAIIGAADVQVKMFVVMASGSGGLQIDNPEVVAGVGYLASSGLITADRAKAVLAGQAPPSA